MKSMHLSESSEYIFSSEMRERKLYQFVLQKCSDLDVKETDSAETKIVKSNVEFIDSTKFGIIVSSELSLANKLRLVDYFNLEKYAQRDKNTCICKCVVS